MGTKPEWTLRVLGLAFGAALVAGACSSPSSDSGAFTGGAPAACAETCPMGLVCDASLGCVACITNTDCGAAHPVCIAGSCEECGTNKDCGVGKSCFPGDHACEPTCTASTQCMSGDNRICNLTTGACVACEANADCPAGSLCDPTFGRCSECSTSADCGIAKPFCDAGGTCRECLLTSSCSLGQTCTDGECVTPPQPCKLDADCTSGGNPHCDVSSGQCFECIIDSQCTADQKKAFCSAMHACVECVTNAQCDNGTCDGNQCKGGG